jgi:Flp pilus assembly protein TadB
MSPATFQAYRERRDAFARDLAAARRSSAGLSNARLAIFLLAAGAFLAAVFLNAVIPALLALVAGIALFAWLVAKHDCVARVERFAARMEAINADGLARMRGEWNRLPADGAAFLEANHPFAGDLDCFGPASLFQYLNAAQTRFGRRRLAGLLSGPPRPRESILADQALVRDLAPRLDFRQRLQAAGADLHGRENPEPLLAWAEDPSEPFDRPSLIRLLRFLPAASALVAFVVGYLLHSPLGIILPVLLQLGVSGWSRRRHGPVLSAIAERKADLEAYLELLRLLESGRLLPSDGEGPGKEATAGPAPGLADSERAGPAAGARPSERVGRLVSMADWMETRRNPLVHFVVDTAFLWDIQWLWAFRRWKRGNGPRLRGWLDAIARVEALSSLAIPAFENPDWVFPEIAEEGPLLQARDMGHPLIPAGRRVANDFALDRPGEIRIITGSNMSGKSTLLRTVGVNLVLAYAGAPVCASSFRCVPLEIHTSMRLRDDLEKRVSSFYAELLRIKGIVEAAKAGGRVLFLVDEIFRGTNSRDRHEGAETVLRRLHDLGASGLVSTHDLELARLQEMAPGHFRNAHFQESYVDGEIRFDFRLREGVSKTTNAMHLIRMAGL